jgi:D-glycero-alpha-D-manno-heptose 1-phosphate guanylyltransferase
MEAIVLAGGYGTRLQGVVPDLPKPMAPIGNRPFLEILLAFLARKGFTRIVLSLGFMAEKIMAHFGDSFLGMELIYEVEPKPMGTGGAIRQALTCCKADHVFVFNGDSYIDVEIDDLEALWQKNRCPVMAVRYVHDTARFGRVELNNGWIDAFCEKGVKGPGFINAGCYVLPVNALDDFALAAPFSLEGDYFIKYLSNIRFAGFITRGFFIDIGIPEDYSFAQKALKHL